MTATYTDLQDRRGNLQHRDCAVVVEDYGLVTERIVYHLDVDGRVMAGEREATAS